MKIISVVGARPQFIKAAMVSRAVRKLPFAMKEVLVHTGQHYDTRMSGVFFKELKLPRPAYYLGVGSHSHGRQTGRMLEKLEQVFMKEKPDIVLVYGDTNSTLAGALAASKLHIVVAHVEAGMRSFNRTMPEEQNRVVVDHLSDILLCSSETAVKNLAREGIRNGLNVGDVMYDALKKFYAVARVRSDILKRLRLTKKAYFLATIHRAENTDDTGRLRIIFGALNAVASRGNLILLPLHPRTKRALAKIKLARSKWFQWLDPVSYLDMLVLEKNAAGILTDSGGVQKEAFFFKVPAVTLRTETEWTETVESGWNRLAPLQHEGIKKAFADMTGFKKTESPLQVYGRGRSAEKIARFLAKF